MSSAEPATTEPAAALTGFVIAFIDHLSVERGASAHTVGGYRRDLRRYLDFLHGRGIDAPDRIDRAAVTGFAASLHDAGLAAASIARAVVAVRSLHAFGAAEGMTTTNPAVDVSPPAPGRRLPKALTMAQVTALLAAPDRAVPAGLRDAALVELLYGTGARISELVDLDVDDVAALVEVDADPTLGLRLIGKGDKERLVPVGSYARAALSAWLVRGRPALAGRARHAVPALFLNARGGRLSRQSAWGILQTCARRAELEVEISPHTLRHTYATHLLDGGADVRVVQELLGHASVTTTQIYTLVTVDHLREVYATAHPRAR